ncbi:MAG: glycosyltransferase family 4 protein [Candidatus Moranbacteria bacterium]|nr:glycosyltransferase family 4 protein [Candidatus Moranbacteria bacterium]
MRIGIDARFYGSSGKGLGRYTERLIEALEEEDRENEYVVFLRRENFDEYRPISKRFTKVRADYAWYGFAEQFIFPWQLWRAGLDLMHFPHFNVPILYPGRFIVTIHDLILLRYPTVRNTTRSVLWYRCKFLVYRMVIRIACFRSDAVITVSRFTESDLLTEFPFLSGKLQVTSEGASRSCFFTDSRTSLSLLDRFGLIAPHLEGPRLGTSHDIIYPYFLYVGNAYPHKNLELVADMARRFPEHRFVLVGREDYFYNRLKQRVSLKNLRFTGFLSDTEISVLYRYGTAYIFPSLYEGFGLPPLEAMSYGLPVLSSDRGSLPEVLGDAALYFDPEDPEQFASCLQEVSMYLSVRESLRKKGYQRIRLFNWSNMAKRTMAVYRASS